MGQEIRETEFTPADFAAFGERLRLETALLRERFAEGDLEEGPPTGGFELEAWLVDERGEPLARSEELLTAIGDPLVVPELGDFNLELNGAPARLEGDALSRLGGELDATWRRCQQAAERLGGRLAMIGILPTARPEQFSLAHMAPRRRYRALNQQIFGLRRGRPLELHIEGHDQLSMQHQDVMLEAAATSFQIHRKVGPGESARFYNAAKILAAPLVAVGANSPFLFGCSLWAETRIPLFEQAVGLSGGPETKRVTFGLGYAKGSVLQCFEDNLAHFAVLLPQRLDEPAERLPHLRLHNGTIWRWNRPLIGFGESGPPHLRVEHRVLPAGPSLPDMIANAALFLGAIESLANDPEPPEQRLPFTEARANFYAAAKGGLGARLHWLDGRGATAEEVIRHHLLPAAHRGLARLQIDAAEIRHWLGIIEARLETGQTGAAWQRGFAARHGADPHELILAYLERQESGLPVHRWPL